MCLIKSRFNKKSKLFLIFIIICFVGYGFWYFENKSIQVTSFEISNTKIPKEFNGFTIVQGSDLHNTEFGRNQSDLINKIKCEDPDIVVITGDLIYKRSKDTKYALDFIYQVVNIAPVYFVTGNHEAQIDECSLEVLYKELINAGVLILDNKSIKVNFENSNINLIGINDSDMYCDGYKKDDEIISDILSEIKVNDSEFNVLLSHKPEFIEIYNNYGYDLVFSGHAHGGQIRIPFVGGVWAPGQGIFPKYTQGKYVYHDTTMIVSRGLGKSIIPLRIFNRPELVICRLKND